MHAPVLKYFREVAERGSIRQAANTLNIASSAVNRQILKLEESLGVQLFERVPGGVQLTHAGRILQTHVRETLADFDRVTSEIDELKGLKTGFVRITALGSLMVEFLPEAIREFSEENGGIQFEVLEMGPTEAVEEVIAGRADMALTFTHALEHPVHIVAEMETPIGAVMSASHPLAKKNSITLKDCSAYPLLLHQMQLAEGPTSRAAFAAAGIKPDPVLISNSLAITKEVLRARLGVAFFTRIAFRQEISDGELVHVPFADDRSFGHKIGIVVAKGRRLSPAASAVADRLKMNLGKI